MLQRQEETPMDGIVGCAIFGIMYNGKTSKSAQGYIHTFHQHYNHWHHRCQLATTGPVNLDVVCNQSNHNNIPSFIEAPKIGQPCQSRPFHFPLCMDKVT